jgi:ribosome-binding protein aMBF1 (putative translation factor)
MKKHRGYLCEHCGKKVAKYEARLLLEGRNILVCFDCLKELNRLKRQPLFVGKEPKVVPWGTPQEEGLSKHLIHPNFSMTPRVEETRN